MEPDTRRSKVQRLKEFNKVHPLVLPALIGIALYLLLGFFLWGFVSPEDSTQKKDFAQLMAQIAGGVALLFGLYFTWRRVEISQRTLETQQDQQVTERFTRAIDQLGATDDKGKLKLEIRLGGIYALERIARDSPERDYSTVMEVLTAYVRENAPWSSKETFDSTTTPKDEASEQKENGEQDKAGATKEPSTPLEPRADIRAVVDALRRREEDRVPEGRRTPLDLRQTYLYGANLQGANLEGANLRGATLRGATLRGAILYGANLQGAILYGANLQEAEYLTQKQLEEAIGDETTILRKDRVMPKRWTKSEGT